MMENKKQLLELIKNEIRNFKKLEFNSSIVPNSIPILWFGDLEKYFLSEKKIITVSLNPSDNEFKKKDKANFSTSYRFKSYDGTAESIYLALNEYFDFNPYNKWFKASFSSVLKGFDASHYSGSTNTALHTDIGSPFATNPTWSGLSGRTRSRLEQIGSIAWHELVNILKPNVILFSASPGFEKKILFDQKTLWQKYDVVSKRPLLKGKFEISPGFTATVLFQVQGRKPFLQTNKEQKLEFHKFI